MTDTPVPPDDPSAPAPHPVSRFDGLREFQQAVRSVLAELAQADCREIILCDADFADWPLGEIEVVASLQAWARSHRRLLLLASQYDSFARQHVRWVQWRRNWSHIVECRAVEHLTASELPSVLYAPRRLALRRVDPERHRGSIERVPADLTPVADLLQDLADRAVPAFPVTTLGL